MVLVSQRSRKVVRRAGGKWDFRNICREDRVITVRRKSSDGGWRSGFTLPGGEYAGPAFGALLTFPR